MHSHNESVVNEFIPVWDYRFPIWSNRALDVDRPENTDHVDEECVVGEVHADAYPAVAKSGVSLLINDEIGQEECNVPASKAVRIVPLPMGVVEFGLLGKILIVIVISLRAECVGIGEELRVTIDAIDVGDDNCALCAIVSEKTRSNYRGVVPWARNSLRTNHPQ